MLDALGDGPADAAALLDRLSARYDVADAAIDIIAARLDELVLVGLAWRA